MPKSKIAASVSGRSTGLPVELLGVDAKGHHVGALHAGTLMSGTVSPTGHDGDVPKLGVCLVPTQPPERLRSIVQSAEAAGLDEFWVWEDCFKESAIASAAAALAWTSRITVGIGIMPTPLRNAALCAMELATLARMFPGRLIAGLGHGVQEWMGQTGARVASPLTLMEEYRRRVRRLLAGERISVDGRYVRLDDVALDWPPDPPPPLMLGGTGPKSVSPGGPVERWQPARVRTEREGDR